MSNKPRTLDEIKQKRRKHRNTHHEVHTSLSKLDKFALWITNKVGTIGFFLIIFIWTVCWLTWNMLAPDSLRFDPYPAFVLWLFISNMLQILLMPLIMVGQNLQGKHSEARAEYDLEINLKNEEEIEIILEHLEYQNRLLLLLMKEANIKLDDILDETKDNKPHNSN